MFESLKNIELTEQQAEELKLFLNNYKKKLTESIKKQLKKEYQEKQKKYFNKLKKNISQKIGKIIESKDNKIKKLKKLSEEKLVDLVSMIQDRTERKIIKENIESDPVYISFNKIKEIISPYVNTNLPSFLINENKSVEVKNNFDKIISFLKRKKIPGSEVLTILENINLFENTEDIIKKINKRIERLNLQKETNKKEINEVNLKKNLEKNNLKDLTMQKNNEKKLKLKQNILESIIKNINLPPETIYNNYLKNKRKIFKLLNENEITKLYLTLSEAKNKPKKNKKIKKIIKKRETIYTPESITKVNEEKEVIKENTSVDKFMQPLKRNISLK